jgi:hypothetical protein
MPQPQPFIIKPFFLLLFYFLQGFVLVLFLHYLVQLLSVEVFVDVLFFWLMGQELTAATMGLFK